MTGSKEVRAMPSASQMNFGRMAMLKAPWNASFTEEAASFPFGKHDDQVDALSLALNRAAGEDGRLAEWWLL